MVAVFVMICWNLLLADTFRQDQRDYVKDAAERVPKSIGQK